MSPLYRICRWIFRFVFRWIFCWRIYHVERIPKEGPVILASNHASYIDPPLVGAASSRPVVFLARESLFRSALSNWFLRRIHAVPLDRDGTTSKGLKTTVDALKRNQVLLIFPEGTRSPDGGLLPVHSGVPMLAIKTHAALIPVRVFGTYEAMNRESFFPKPTRLSVVFGNPVDLKDLKGHSRMTPEQRKECYKLAADRLFKAINELEPCTEVSRFPNTP